MVFGNLAIMTWNICFDQKSMQRIIALPSLSHSRRSLTLFAVGMCFVVLLSCSTGIIMYAYYYDCDPIRAKVNSCFKFVFDSSQMAGSLFLRLSAKLML